MKNESLLAGSYCKRERTKCLNCGHLDHLCSRFEELKRCPSCGSDKLEKAPWWYGMPLPEIVMGKKLADGRKVIPKWFVQVRAALNPVSGGDPFLSWLAAEDWFKEQGWEILADAEWDAYNQRRERPNEEGVEHFFEKE